MNFKIRDGDYLPYDEIKKDYENGLVGKALMDKYGITNKAYTGLLDRLEADGVKLARKRYAKKPIKKPTYVYPAGNRSWMVRKWVNGEYIYGGCFKTKALAEQKVRELGWVK